MHCNCHSPTIQGRALLMKLIENVRFIDEISQNQQMTLLINYP